MFKVWQSLHSNMRLTHIAINGYRSIRELEVDCSEFCALVGENSSGKSTILRSIDYLLNRLNSVDELDFHRSPGNEAEKIIITGTFTELSQEERERVSNIIGPYVETLRVKKTLKYTDGSKRERTYIEIPQAENELLNISYISGSTKSEYHEAIEKGELPEYFLGDEEKGLVADLEAGLRKYLSEHYTEIDYTDAEYTRIKGQDLKALYRILPEPLYVPAFDSIKNHVTPKRSNIFSKLLRNIFDQLSNRNDRDLHRLNNQLKNLTRNFRYDPSHTSDRRFDEIKDLEQELSGYLESILPNSQVRLDFDQPELADLLADHFEIKLHDGVLTPVEHKGHGAQRTIIWALLRSYLTNLSNKGDKSVIFLVEEPELYLHPQAQRVMLDVLRKLADHEQVIYSTHSAVFIDLTRPETIRLIRKENYHTVLDTISNSTLDYHKNEIRFLTWVDDERSELFFAKSVVLVEGETEKVLMQQINQDQPNGKSLDELGCQVVVTGGKFAMPFYSHLLTDLRIPYFVIFDQDSSTGKHQKTNDHIKKAVRRAKREEDIPAQYHVFHPFLEEDWDIHEQDQDKPQFLLEWINNWDSPPSAYQDLSEQIYQFAEQH